MGLITSTTGSSDVIISRTMKTDLTFDPFFDESIIDDKLQDIDGVEEFFPRIMMLVKVSSDKTDSNGTLQIYGINFIKEANNGHMGNLNLVNQNGTETGGIYTNEPGMGECVILFLEKVLLRHQYLVICHLMDCSRIIKC